jgi:hypothetical protein
LSKASAIPVRLEVAELDAVDKLVRRTGLSRSEILRRATNLLFQKISEEGNAAAVFEKIATAGLVIRDEPPRIEEPAQLNRPPAAPVSYASKPRRPRKTKTAA